MAALTVVYWSLAEGELHRAVSEQVPEVGEVITIAGGRARVILRDFAIAANGAMELMVQVEFETRRGGRSRRK